MNKKIMIVMTILLMAISAAFVSCGSNDAGTDSGDQSTVSSQDGSDDTAADNSMDPAAGADGAEAAPEYATTLFDSDFVHTINIEIAQSDWADLLKNPTEKTKYKTNVTIDGVSVNNVSFATKGNSSLYYVADYGKSQRYSFKIKFDKYTEGQTWKGLDCLDLQNFFADATCMKEHLSYDLFRAYDIPAPLSSYIWVTINGKAQGLYLAVEPTEQSFLDRNFAGKGTLYSPENSSLELDEDEMDRLKAGGKADGAGATGDEAGATGDEAGATGDEAGENANKSGTKAGKSTCKGADLVYTGNNPKHYSDIFDNAKTKDNRKTQKRVIKALKKLSNNKQLEKYLNTDEIIRYFAVHNYLANYDSYAGQMLHNYVLYENGGQLSMLPWDYNLSFGSFPKNGIFTTFNDANIVVNEGINTPLYNIKRTDRPMWNWIISNRAYRLKYYKAFHDILDGSYHSGDLEKELASTYEMILPYVKKDPTAFYTTKQFKKASVTMTRIARLRAESIERQLNKQLSPITSHQKDHNRVDASDIQIEDMGPHFWE